MPLDTTRMTNFDNTHFFYKKHKYKKHWPISPKTIRNIQGYPLKFKKDIPLFCAFFNDFERFYVNFYRNKKLLRNI